MSVELVLKNLPALETRPKTDSDENLMKTFYSSLKQEIALKHSFSHF